MGEAQVNAQTVHSRLYERRHDPQRRTTLMIAGQFWLTPQLWIKGGIGFAHLRGA